MRVLALFEHWGMTAKLTQINPTAEAVVMWSQTRILWRHASEAMRGAALAELRKLHPRATPDELRIMTEGAPSGRAVLVGGCTVQPPPQHLDTSSGVVPYNPPESDVMDVFDVLASGGVVPYNPPPLNGLPSGLTADEVAHWGKVTELARCDVAELSEAFDLPDFAIAEQAADASARVRRLCQHWRNANRSPNEIRELLEAFALGRSIKPDPALQLSELVARMRDELWWRRQLRRRFRIVEQCAIEAGEVHREASPYASARALDRARRDGARLQAMLEDYEMENLETGDVLSLADLVEASLANPSNRRKALGARIAGVEEWATEGGLVAVFTTITCPSRFHPFTHDGMPNPKYQGTTPRDAQAWLSAVWKKAIRRMKHKQVQPLGLRVTEPHHSATPHWHVLAWLTPGYAVQVWQDTIARYALADDGAEPGAKLRRVTHERIDPTKGSAVGYVLKYISKSIDGEGVGVDDETGKPAHDAARSITTWSRLWGIRQFQFFGLPPITPTREMYRAQADQVPDYAQSLKAAADANDYAQWLRLLDTSAVTVETIYKEKPSARYEGEVSKYIEGIDVANFAGSGPFGRVMWWDSDNFSSEGSCTVQPPPVEQAPAPAPVPASFGELAAAMPFDELRASIARAAQLGVTIVTRSGNWVLRRKARGADSAPDCPPRTRFNNSAVPQGVHPGGAT